MFKYLVSSFLLAAADALSEPVLHPAPALPDGWAQTNNIVEEDESVAIRFSLKQQNVDKLVDMARKVSDPQDTSYGKYLSSEEIKKLTKPSSSHLKSMQQWLGANNVAYTSKGSHGIEVYMSVKAAKALLQTDFYAASNAATSQQVLLASSYSLPADVDAAVIAVYGLHGLPLPPRTILAPPAKPANVTPGVLAQTYNVSGVTISGSTKNRQAVAEFQGQTLKPADLVKFFDSYVPGSKANSIYKFVGDNGTAGQGPPGVESSLDVDYIMGVAPGVLTEFWYYKSMDFCGDLVNWTDSILDSEDPPLVHSVSYGWQGNLSQIQCTQAHVNDVDSNLAKLAARGISIIISSGDSGSGYSQQSSCSDESAYAKSIAIDQGKLVHSQKERDVRMCCFIAQMQAKNGSWTFNNDTCNIYENVTSTKTQSGALSGGSAFSHPKVLLYPSWPASSAWVTSVGATRFVDNKVGSAEMATDQFGSGGGFSSMFDAFKDQTNAVQHYLKTVKRDSKFPPDGSFPTGGRATPDVSALGEGFQVVQSGNVLSVGGTSASAPSFAGFVSLLNEARLKAGKPAMGYLNPFLYQNQGAFRDVTVGTNAIGRGTGPIAYGFPCAPGWDPATGLGTPNFEKLLSLAMSKVGVADSIVV